MSRLTTAIRSFPVLAARPSAVSAPLLAAGPLAVWLASAGGPPWTRMWLLALSIYALCKWCTWRLASGRAASAPPWRSWAYLLAWPGMAAAEFLDLRQRAVPPGKFEYLLTAANSSLGAGFLLLASTDAVLSRPQIAPWLGLLALGLLLHCGLFHGLSILWRRAGIAAPPIMHWPIRATSVADFWGRRWNLAFRELANRFVYRPLIARVGATAALVITFLISGLVHDLVISLPAGAGYGWPTLYFLLQGAGVLIEHSHTGRRWGLGRGLMGRLFAAVVVLAPIGLMFHRSFLDRVMLPMLQVIAAW